MRKLLLSLFVVLTTAMSTAYAAATMPVTSTADNPVMYYISNTRSHKSATLPEGLGKLTQEAARTEAAQFWFEADGEMIDDTYLPVKIHNATTSMVMAGFNEWDEEGATWYIRLNPSDANYFAIGTAPGDEGSTANWWNDARAEGQVIESWTAGDGGSRWAIAPVQSPVKYSSSRTNATWYRMALRGNKYLHYDGSGISVTAANADRDDLGSYFCLVGDENGFKFYNAACLANQALGGAAVNNGKLTPVDESEATTFVLENWGFGFVIHNPVSADAYVQDNNSSFAYWMSTNNHHDFGSQCIFEEVDAETAKKIANTAFLKYNYYYEGELVKTVELMAPKGDPYPAAPGLPVFCTAEVPNGTVFSNAEFDINVVVDSAFPVSKDYASAKWVKLYNLKDGGNYYLHMNGAEKYALTQSPENISAMMWAFVGNPFVGYQIINKAAGEGKYLDIVDPQPNTANFPTMTDNPAVWTVELSTLAGYEGAFGLSLGGHWINNNNKAYIGTWVSGPTGDLGSTLFIEEVEGEVYNDVIYATSDLANYVPFYQKNAGDKFVVSMSFPSQDGVETGLFIRKSDGSYIGPGSGTNCTITPAKNVHNFYTYPKLTYGYDLLGGSYDFAIDMEAGTIEATCTESPVWPDQVYASGTVVGCEDEEGKFWELNSEKMVPTKTLSLVAGSEGVYTGILDMSAERYQNNAGLAIYAFDPKTNWVVTGRYSCGVAEATVAVGEEVALGRYGANEKVMFPAGRYEVTFDMNKETLLLKEIPATDIAIVDGVYQLATAEDVEQFAWLQNTLGGNRLNAVVVADIDMAGVNHVAIGTDFRKFVNTFDGQGHTISNLTVENGLKEQGFFGVAGPGAVVKNLNLVNVNVKAGHSSAMLIGCTNNDGVITIENVGVEGNVDASATDRGQNAAGLVGCNYGGGTKIVIKNAYIAGTITGKTECGAVSGWLNWSNSTLENVWSLATVNGTEGDQNLYRAGATMTNCYDASATANRGQGKILDPAAAASGELAYLINNNPDAPAKVAYQTVGVDAYPTLDPARGEVFKTRKATCLGKVLVPVCYANVAGKIIVHEEDENGACVLCGNDKLLEAKKDADGWYHLASAEDVEWFSAMVNQGRVSMCAKLDSDIDYGKSEDAPYGYDHTPIGLNSTPKMYAGSFDGQNHRIKNMVIDENTLNVDAKDGVGFFGTVRVSNTDRVLGVTTGDITIQNLTIDESCSISHASNVAGIVARVGGGKAANTLTIKNCANEADLTASKGNVAGILGNVDGVRVGVVIENCFNLGDIKAESGAAAAICAGTGPTQSGMVKKADNCFNAGTVTSVSADGSNMFINKAGSDIVMTNLYELNEENKKTGVQGVEAGLTAAAVASGEMTVLFNENAYAADETLAKDVVYQWLGAENSRPSFDGAQRVYMDADGEYLNYLELVDSEWTPLERGNLNGKFTFTYKAEGLVNKDAAIVIMDKKDYEENGLEYGKHLYGALARRNDISYANGVLDVNFTYYSGVASEITSELFKAPKLKFESNLSESDKYVVIFCKDFFKFEKGGVYTEDIVLGYSDQEMLGKLIAEAQNAEMGGTTAIEAVNANIENLKVYTLSGVRVDKVQKGQVYIINGKKTMVK